MSENTLPNHPTTAIGQPFGKRTVLVGNWLKCTLPITAMMIVAACSGTPKKSPYDLQIGVGEKFVESGDYERGNRILNDVAEKNPKSSNVQLALGNSYFDQHAYVNAQSSYDTAIKLGKVKEGHLGKARVALAQNNPDRAIELLAPILQKNPKSIPALNSMGVAHDLKGNHKQAQVHYQQVLNLDPNNMSALNNMALSKTLSGDKKYGDKLFSSLYSSALGNKTIRQNTALVKALNGKANTASKILDPDLKSNQINDNMKTAKRLRQAL